MGFVFSPVKTGPTSGVPQKAKVVPKKRKVLLKSRTVNSVKRAMPKADSDLGWGLYDNTSQSQPVPTAAPRPTNPEEFLSLKELCKGKSLSVFRLSDPRPPVQKPAVEVPKEDLAFAAMETLMESGLLFFREPVPEVDPSVSCLDSLRAARLTISLVSPTIPSDSVKTEDQTDTTWGGGDKW